MADPLQDEDPLGRVQRVTTTDPFPASSFLTTARDEGVFALVEDGQPGRVLVSETDDPGVQKVAGWFCRDLGYVSEQAAALTIGDRQAADRLVIVGTAGRSKVIDRLVREGRIDVSVLKGRREQFLIIPVRNPMKGVGQALVIAGSDKRGTIYGMCELSQQMGVSPWYWWADVPVKVRRNIFVKPGAHTLGEPRVKYRGIFINDEAPALSGWVAEKYGDFNRDFYERVFELILRLKGNYLWPAMWGRSLWDDDSLSAPLADSLGVVLATSHHEPLMRAHVEWSRYGEGPWNYEANAERLRAFWRQGIARTKDYESVVTLAMRGDGDEAMSDETNIELLETIVRDQRSIIEAVTGRPARETPQVWALYKEVQDYYDRGMRVPDDVTLLICDDNWGQVRMLPQPGAAPRAGGYGIYYHFDYVGGPRSYKWLNTVQIERVWEQMHLAYAHGVDEIWLVNVGDIKPMELPISFFLDYAWDPARWPADRLPDYYTAWAEGQFGAAHAAEIGEMLALYTKYNARRKPELLAPTTYSLLHFDEAETVVRDYRALAARAQAVAAALPATAQDAFYQLVGYPVEACANLNEMYVAAGKNRYYRLQSRASANYYADRVKELFFRDAALTRHYHEAVAAGKWNRMMSQTHIGYTTWSDPPVNNMPEVSYIHVGQQPRLGYVLEQGAISPRRHPMAYSNRFLPFDPINDQTRYIEVFNMGSQPLHFTLAPENDWILLSADSGTIQYEEKIYLHIDWDRVPAGTTTGSVVISGAGQQHVVQVPVRPQVPAASGFVERNGIVSIEATRYQHARTSGGISWIVVPNLGRTGAAVTSAPVTAPRQQPGGDSPALGYELTLLDSGLYELTAYFSPTLNFQKDEGLVYAFSVDEGAPVVANLHAEATVPDWQYPAWWNNAVSDNIMKQTVLEVPLAAGPHTLTYWLGDPGLVLQKIVLQKKDLATPSYLGPPETWIAKPASQR